MPRGEPSRFLTDGHLDLAYNVGRGRDVTKPAAGQPVVDHETATCGLPDLAAGGVSLAIVTLFAEPRSALTPGGYVDAAGAYRVAGEQRDWYQSQIAAGRLRAVRCRADLPPPVVRAASDPLPVVLLMEGADPIRTVDDVAFWFAAGVRLVGLAWKATRYTAGTGRDGPLTSEGIELLQELDRFGMIHDVSHLAETAARQLFDHTGGPVVSTHSNGRALLGDDPAGRHLSDDTVRRVAGRGGVIGINFLDSFLIPSAERKRRRATLGDVVRHVRHVCDLVGDHFHVGLGTDLDGGFGRERVPIEIESAADLPKVAEGLSSSGFDDAAVLAIVGQNWLDCLRRSLPQT